MAIIITYKVDKAKYHFSDAKHDISLITTGILLPLPKFRFTWG